MIPYVLRPIRLTDLDDLKSLTDNMEDSIASLPNDKALLIKRIKLSVKSFLSCGSLFAIIASYTTFSNY